MVVISESNPPKLSYNQRIWIKFWASRLAIPEDLILVSLFERQALTTCTHQKNTWRPIQKKTENGYILPLHHCFAPKSNILPSYVEPIRTRHLLYLLIKKSLCNELTIEYYFFHYTKSESCLLCVTVKAETQDVFLCV